MVVTLVDRTTSSLFAPGDAEVQTCSGALMTPVL